jgi:phage/plasmid-like protein (TIGR03299 family)
MSYIRPKGLPFVYPGVTDVTDCTTSEEVMTKAKLNWNVVKQEIYSKSPVEEFAHPAWDKVDHRLIGNELFMQVPNGYAVCREDNKVPLGIVKDRYTPVQNIDAFKFFDSAIGKNEAIWQTAGCFGNGERIFVSAKLPDTISVKGDPVDSYLVFTNSHDGSTGVKILFTPIRVICFNMLNAAVRKASSYISFRHTKSVHDNINTAKEILGICKVTCNILQEAYTEMYRKKVSDDKFQTIIGDLVFSEAEKAALKEGGYSYKSIFDRNWNAIDYANISTQKIKMISNIELYYHEGPGQKEIEGTGWGVYNAVTGYYSNMENNEGAKRMDTLLYGDRSRKIETIGNLILV